HFIIPRNQVHDVICAGSIGCGVSGYARGGIPSGDFGIGNGSALRIGDSAGKRRTRHLCSQRQRNQRTKAKYTHTSEKLTQFPLHEHTSSFFLSLFFGQRSETPNL